LTGRPDVTTALVTNGRPEAVDGDKLFGLFLNSVPFRFQVAAGSCLELSDRVKEIEREMFPHRRYPLPAIMRDAGIRERLSVLFNYTHFHVYDELGDLGDQVAAQGAEGDDSFGLSVDFQLRGSNMVSSIRGRRSIYDQSTLKRYATCYARLLCAITNDA